MLYDNSQLARIYLHAWQVTGNEFFVRTPAQIHSLRQPGKRAHATPRTSSFQLVIRGYLGGSRLVHGLGRQHYHVNRRLVGDLVGVEDQVI